MSTVPVKLIQLCHDDLVLCQQIIQGERVDVDVRDAAGLCIDAYRAGKGIDKDVVQVLVNHVAKRGAQDRWGK